MTYHTYYLSIYIINIIYYNGRRTNVKILFYFLEYMLLKDTLIFDTRKKYLHFILYILLSFLALLYI